MLAQVTFLGQGPLGQMTTVYRDNMVKGFVVNPDCETALKSDGKVRPLIFTFSYYQHLRDSLLLIY